MARWTREPVAFASQGSVLDADLFRPQAAEPPPVVVMAHGLGACRSFGLAPFAARFADDGMAVLVFDYRGFGASEGEPRALVSPQHHLQDWAAAVEFARTLDGVDGSRVGLWGTSFAGGHVLVTAARTRGIAAVVAQVPHVDGMASSLRYPPGLLPRALRLGATDLAASRRGRPPVRIPVVAESGVRALAGPDCFAEFQRLAGGQTIDDIPARILLTVQGYRPTREVHRITAPTLVIAANEDSLIPITAVRKAAAKISGVRLEEIDGGHFAPYWGDCFEDVVDRESGFLRTALQVGL